MKIWLEMSRDENHGGGEWGFTRCLWSPTRKKTGQKWAHWETVRQVEAGDLVLHLRGETGRKAKFTGWSTAEADAEETSARPPSPGLQWEYSRAFYRVRLGDYAPLKTPLALSEVLARQKAQLLEYFERNKKRKVSCVSSTCGKRDGCSV